MQKKEKSKSFFTRLNHPKHNRGALLILALVFTLSAGARLASGTGAAIAREINNLAADDIVPQESPHTEQGVVTQETIKILLEDLKAREQILIENENLMVRKMKAYELAKVEIEKNMTALKEAEQKLSSTMAVAKTAAEDDLIKLTTVYENMKPKEAAALFEQMAPDFAAGFLSRMRPDAAAPVMAGLTPEVAYSISVILAGRNANAPSE